MDKILETNSSFHVKWHTMGNVLISIFQEFLTKTIHKVFEINFSFHVKQRTTGKVQFLFFSRFLLVLTKSSFWE